MIERASARALLFYGSSGSADLEIVELYDGGFGLKADRNVSTYQDLASTRGEEGAKECTKLRHPGKSRFQKYGRRPSGT
jgi:hypothetical protein